MPDAASEENLANLRAALGNQEKLRKELEAKVSELVNMLTTVKTTQATLRIERDKAVSQLAASLTETAQARAATTKVESDLERFREMAVAALTPIGTEYKRTMKTLLKDLESLRLDIAHVQTDTHARFSALLEQCANLEERTAQIRRTFASELSMILGAEADLTPLPAPRKK